MPITDEELNKLNAERMLKGLDEITRAQYEEDQQRANAPAAVVSAAPARKAKKAKS